MINAGVIGAFMESTPDVLLFFADANYTGDGGYLRNPFTDELLGPFASNNLPQFVHEGRRYACPFELRTNKADYSQAIDQWANAGNASTITPNDAIAPDGTLTADLLEMDGVTSYSRYYTIAQGDSTEMWSSGLWAKAADGPSIGKTFRFALNGAAGFSLKVEGILTANWKHYSASHNVKAANLTVAYLNLMDEPDIGDPALPAYKAHVWGHMIEHAPFPSAYYIPTPGTGDVARAKDQLSWPAALVPAAILSGKWACRWSPFFANDEPAAVSTIIDASAGDDRIYYYATTDKMFVKDASATAVQSNALTFARNPLITTEYDSPVGKVTVAGAVGGNGPVTGTPWSWTAGGNPTYGAKDNWTQYLNSLISEPYRPQL